MGIMGRSVPRGDSVPNLLTAARRDRIREVRRNFGPASRDESAATKRGDRRGRKQPPGTEGALAVIYGEPDTPRFLAAVQRLKKQQQKKERQTRLAKQRVREALRKKREC
jgi:hypothetical protein